MFRIGGSAGGITSGLRRGYANGEDVQISDELLGSPDYQGGTTTSDLINEEEVTPSGNNMDTMLQNMMTDFPEPPKSSAGSDFLMNLGLNLMSLSLIHI